MNQTIRLILISLIIILFWNPFFAAAQPNWQWGKRGGSFAGPSAGNEYVISTETDLHGNVYVLSKNAMGAFPQVDGHLGTGIYDQITIASWNCNGSFRWMKNFGSAAAVTSCGMGIDSNGSIYMAGIMQSYNSAQYGYFDSDTVLGNQTKSMYIVKYDSLGNLQWLRRPQPQAFDVTSGTNGVFGFLGIDASKDGEVYIFGYLSAGAYENGAFTVPNKGYYILKYNRDGLYQSILPVDMGTTDGGFTYNIDGQSNVFSSKFARDFKNNRFYIYGQYYKDRGNLKFGNTNISATGGTLGYPIFLAAFNSAGNSIWVKQSSADGYAINRYCKPVIDNMGNIYIGGDASPQGGNSFNGHTFVNSDISYLSVPFVISLDTSGSNRWVSTGSPNNMVLGSCLAYRNSKIWFGGAYTDKLKWGGFNLDTDAGIAGGYIPFLSSFNAVDGTILSMDTVIAATVTNEPTAMCVDKNNNIYVGGSFGEAIYIANDTLNSAGGNDDWFVDKFGTSNCSCAVPTPNFSYSSSGTHTLNFTYTGTTPYTSISWDFDDGSPAATTANPTHSYATAGMYTVCVSVANTCGSNTYCLLVNTNGGTSIGNVPNFAAVTIFPNPASQILNIYNVNAGTLLEVYHVTGTRMLLTEVKGNKEAIDVAKLPAGIYMLRITDKKGKQGSTRFVKQY